MTKKLIIIAGITFASLSFAYAGHRCCGDEGSSGHSKEKADIVDTAATAGQFKTLTVALEATDLVKVLKGEGPFTVFAPTDEAFAALPEGTLENLLKPENKDQLVAILTYHVVPGKVMSSDVGGKQLGVATVEGSEVSVNGMSGVTVNGANVIQANIETDNGVIHVIDEVVLPFAPPSACP